MWQALLHPAWTAATLRNGLPRLQTVEKYAGDGSLGNVSGFVGRNFGGTLSWDYLQALRDAWDGSLVVKGILHPADAEKAIAIGVDGIGVSNHGGRQFDGAPAAIDALPAIAQQVNGRAKILFDSGIRTGLDVIRALALGADFVLLGRAFMFGVAAFGDIGGVHSAEILLAELKANMAQLGVSTIDEIKQMHESVMFIYNPQSCEAHTCLNISNSPRVNHYFQHIPHASLMVCIYIYQLYMYMYVRVSAQKM